jgi:DNA-binding CsgD family transcriptional regulator
MSLQAQGAELVAGAMEALSMAVFVCDAYGRVRALSPRAEAIAADGRHLKIRDGVIAACSDTDTRMLRTALNVAAYATLGVRPPTVMVVRDATGSDPLLVEVATLPGEAAAFGLGVAALLIARAPRPEDGRAAMIAKALFGLTQAESAVVADLLNGLDAQGIAERSGVSVGTIRTHLRHIFDKAGVRTQVQLISAITGRL